MNFEEEKVVYVQPVCEDNTERIKEIEQYENEKEVEKRRANSSIIDIAKEFEESNKKNYKIALVSFIVSTLTLLVAAATLYVASK